MKANSTREALWSCLVKRDARSLTEECIHQRERERDSRVRKGERKSNRASESGNLLGGFEWCLFSKQMWQIALWHNSLQMYRKWWPTMGTGTATARWRIRTRMGTRTTPKWVRLSLSMRFFRCLELFIYFNRSTAAYEASPGLAESQEVPMISRPPIPISTMPPPSPFQMQMLRLSAISVRATCNCRR